MSPRSSRSSRFRYVATLDDGRTFEFFEASPHGMAKVIDRFRREHPTDPLRSIRCFDTVTGDDLGGIDRPGSA